MYPGVGGRSGIPFNHLSNFLLKESGEISVRSLSSRGMQLKRRVPLYVKVLCVSVFTFSVVP